MKRKSFIQQFVSLGVGSVIYLLVGLIGTPIITRLVDPVSYGDYSIFGVYSNIGYMICMLGLDQAFVRYYYVNNSIRYHSRLLYECLIPSIVVVAVGGIAAIGITWSLNPNGGVFGSVTELSMIVLHMILLVVNRYGMLNARLQKDTVTYSAISIVQKSLFILFSVALVLWHKNHFYQLLVASTLLSTLIVDIMSVWKQRRIWLPEKADDTIVVVPRREIFRYGIPLMFSSGITLLFNALDKLALDRFCTRADVGVYTSALNLLAVLSVIRSSFSAIWIPSAVEHYEKNPEDVSFFQKGNAFVTILMLIFGAGMIICKDLFVLLLGEEYREAAFVFPFLIFEPIMYTISETTVTGLVVKKKSSYQVLVAVVACVTNFAGNWLLTPRMGPKGAAISTGFSYIIFFALRTFLSNRIFYINYHLPKLIIMITLLAGLAFYGSNYGFSMIQVGFFVLYACILLLVYFKEFKEAYAYGKTVINKYVKGCHS